MSNETNIFDNVPEPTPEEMEQMDKELNDIKTIDDARRYVKKVVGQGN